MTEQAQVPTHFVVSCESHECCMKEHNMPVCVAKFYTGVSEAGCHTAAAGHLLLHRLQLLLRLPHLQCQTSRV